MNYSHIHKKYRSRLLVEGPERAGQRAHLRALGLSEQDMARPFVGVVNSWNAMHPDHIHLTELERYVQKGILQADGTLFEFNTIAIYDGMTQGQVGMRHVLPSRDLIADSSELVVEAQQLCGLVFLGGCDKIEPAMLMALARLNLLAIMLTGGPMMPGHFKGRPVAIPDMREGVGKWKSGQYTDANMLELEQQVCPGPGSCAMMVMANTMACMAEVLGLTLSGCATTHAVSSCKRRMAAKAVSKSSG